MATHSSGPSKFVSVACGHDHSLALTHSGEVFGWGWYHALGLGVGNNVIFVGDPVRIEKLSDFKIKQIAAGYRHSLVLTESKMINFLILFILFYCFIY